MIELWLLDGATGTELTRRGVPTRLPAWSATAVATHPDVLRAIHLDYALAGADVITADTFRTQGRALSRAGHPRRAREWTFEAVRIAREAADQAASERDAPERPPIRVAGSMGPLEDCYEPSLAPDEGTALAEHREQAGTLAEAGVDLLLVETIGTLREARAATRAASETGLETWTSTITDGSGTRLLSGEPLEAWVEAVAPLVPAALLVNCVAPDVAREAVSALVPLAAALGRLAGIYVSLGAPDALEGWSFGLRTEPDEYAAVMAPLLDAGVRIVGGCCGTTPGHIRALRRLLDERIAAARAAAETTTAGWTSLVAEAARMAGGGAAVLLGAVGADLPSGFVPLHLPAEEATTLPAGRFRLAIADLARAGDLAHVGQAVEPGGWLVARLTDGGTPITLEDFELRDVARDGEHVRLLARRTPR